VGTRPPDLPATGSHGAKAGARKRRSLVGKFYHRPPGGESWTDVAQRLRALLDDVRRDARRGRVLLMAHQVVVLLTRYVLEGIDERGVLALDADAEVVNCSVTSYRYEPSPAASRWSATTKRLPSRSRTRS